MSYEATAIEREANNRVMELTAENAELLAKLEQAEGCCRSVLGAIRRGGMVDDHSETVELLKAIVGPQQGPIPEHIKNTCIHHTDSQRSEASKLCPVCTLSAKEQAEAKCAALLESINEWRNEGFVVIADDDPLISTDFGKPILEKVQRFRGFVKKVAKLSTGQNCPVDNHWLVAEAMEVLAETEAK